MGYIHRNEWFFYGLLVVAAVVASLPLYSYRWHTLMHIAGAVVFLGNIIVTGAWMLMAERTRSINVIHFSGKAVIRADFLFALPGVLLILMNGFAMVFSGWGGWSAFHPITWITVALALFILSGIIWVGVLIPVQHQMVVLRPVGLSGRTAQAILFVASQLVHLGRSCNCAAAYLSVPDGQQARLWLGSKQAKRRFI